MKNKKLMQVLEERMYPTIYLTDEELKYIEDLEVGEVYELKLKVKMVGKDMNERGVSGRFEVRKAVCEDED
jgi:hypothetical protein